MLEIDLQLFGGRGAGSGIRRTKDWLDKEGGRPGGHARSMDVSKFKGHTLEQVEKRIRKLGHEELFVFDENNKIIAAYRGNKYSVAFPSSFLNLKGATVTHSHPKGESNFGGTFSWTDVNNMLKSNWAEHRATASGQGEMNYIMRRTSKANSKGLRDRINRDYPKVDKQWRDTYQKSFDEQIKKGKSQIEAAHIARQKGVGVLNAYYKKVFPKYGFEYITRKKDYKYNR